MFRKSAWKTTSPSVAKAPHQARFQTETALLRNSASVRAPMSKDRRTTKRGCPCTCIRARELAKKAVERQRNSRTINDINCERERARKTTQQPRKRLTKASTAQPSITQRAVETRHNSDDLKASRPSSNRSPVKGADTSEAQQREAGGAHFKSKLYNLATVR